MPDLEEICKDLFGHNLNAEELIEHVMKTRNLRHQGQVRRSEASAPVLQNRHPPSTRELLTLRPTTLKKLQRNHRHVGKAIYLTIRSAEIRDGLSLTVQDSEGNDGLVWSLFEFPFPGGKDSVAAGTVVAIKEPFCQHSKDRDISVCVVHHPTDIVRASKFDPIVVHQFPGLDSKAYDDFLEAGDATTDSPGPETIDIYSDLIKLARSTSGEATGAAKSLSHLLTKRAFAYSFLKLHSQAFIDIAEVLTAEPTNVGALKLACIATLGFGMYHAAQGYALGLLAQAPNDDDTGELCERVSSRLLQAVGKNDLGLLAKSPARYENAKDVPTFVRDIEVRKSSLGGRGVFAKNNITRGQLLLHEKSLAISYGSTGTSFRAGLNNLLGEKGDWVSQDTMEFLQQLVSVAATDPRLADQLFNLFDGKERNLERKPEPRTHVFDVYRALSIVKYNFHLVSPPNRREFDDPCSDGPLTTPSIAAWGLWYMSSLFNHSCLPNATYKWIGDVMVVQASHAINEGEEITLNYVPIEETYEGRKQVLAQSGFECFCPLCKADALLPEASNEQRQQIRRVQLRMMGFAKVKDHARLEATVRKCVRSYTQHAELYDGIPYVGLVNILFSLGRTFLGPLSDWPKATQQTKSKAYDCFLATLQVALGIKLVKAPSSAYCELVFTKYSQDHAVGVSALLGLAELAYISEDKIENLRAVTLIRCARELYKIRWGEDATFEDYYTEFRCKANLPYIGCIKPPPRWDELKATTAAMPSPIPEFLRRAPKV